MDDELLYEKRGRVGIITLNRPDRLNALSDGMHEGLPKLWAEVRADASLGAVIVTGAGRGFCVGMDLKRVGERGGFREHKSDKIKENQKLTALQNDVWLPTIVAVNGVCAGGGLHFLADADVILASEDASFVDPHVSVGQVSALEPISLAPRMGLGNALRFAVLGRAGRMDAQEALRVSLVDEVVPADRLLPRAIELAEAAAEGSPPAIEITKRAVWASLELPFEEAMQRGWEMLVAHRSHPDALEGPAAFVEKRTPNWARDA
ncbi:MAG TPA: enoyl-CoA hydratase-related protein [Acidimicrobiales bacterium]|nr:enoyl-CoA hydratase-related protein [Acidimicrobiales bacterium]